MKFLLRTSTAISNVDYMIMMIIVFPSVDEYNVKLVH